MLYDPAIKDACFVEGRPPAQIDEVLEWTRRRLGLNHDTNWRLISARRKLGRTLFEIEETTSRGSRRLIGKLGNSERAQTHFETLKSLRKAGFAPPARYTVPEPVALVAERGMMLQEKVSGQQVDRSLLGSRDESEKGAKGAACWLAALHRCGLSAPVSRPHIEALEGWAGDLSDAEASESNRINKITNAILDALVEPGSPVVPCHGDFHPRNIFIDGDERMTAIDIDKFALREPEADVGWFLMQTTAFGFFDKQSFECTTDARRAFTEQYEAESGRQISPRRVALYMAMAFLKNLHFELVLLQTGRREYVKPWLDGAATAILESNIHLST